MSEYLPSFIVEPVLRQARRFSERIGGEESPSGPSGSSFTLPAVPDFQRFYPTRFWSQSPLPAAVNGGDGVVDPTLDHSSVAEESTLRSIARNIQLWASQINNLDIEDEVIQEPVLPSVEHDDTGVIPNTTIFTQEPEHADLGVHVPPIVSSGIATRELGSRSVPLLGHLQHNNRTNSETSMNPAHELSYRSRILEHDAQPRSHSDPLAAVNVQDAVNNVVQEAARDDQRQGSYGQIGEASGTLPEDDGMRPLRQRINAIWAGPGSAQEKSRLVHATMMERYQSTRKDNTPASSATATSPRVRAASPFSLASIKSDEAVYNLSPSDLQPTYAPLNPDESPDEMTGELPKPDLGCLHYKRNVKMQCATCERWYTCRVCHDEKEDHELPRRDTKHMLCMICGTPQRVSQVCAACHVQTAYYYCAICKLWNNDPNKSIYHCDDCGICRLGQGLGKDFFHCKTCAACMSIAAESTHRCIEKSTKCDCPICGEFMFTSSQPVTFMRCGHSIHETCFTDWCNTSYKCPICSRSIANMESQFRRLDRHIEDQPMPTEYSNNRAYVFCNDCNSRNIVKYHWLGLKCATCDSYNTAQLELLGPESPSIQERADRAQEMGVGEAGITASQSHTPNDGIMTPISRTSLGHASPMMEVSTSTQGSASGTPRSAIAIPGRRNSPFHNLPHSPTRSTRAMSPVVGSYFGTGQRPPQTDSTRRGSYFSVLSFGNATDNAQNSGLAQSRTNTRSLRPSQSHLSPVAVADSPRPHDLSIDTNQLAVQDGAALVDDTDDEDMDFWGGQSPRSQDADIVDLDLEAEEESSSDEDEDMDYEEEDGEEDDDPMDILIGHR